MNNKSGGANPFGGGAGAGGATGAGAIETARTAGAAGATGAIGTAGTTGATGVTGLAGTTSATGMTGATGAAGAANGFGAAGTAGTPSGFGSANTAGAASAIEAANGLGTTGVTNDFTYNGPDAAAKKAMPEGLERPMTKAVEETPVVEKKPVNKKLIIGVICGVGGLVIVGALIAAVVSALNRPDPVANAMNRLLEAGLPTNIHAEATMNVQMTDQTQLVSHYKVTAKSDLMPAKLTNQSDATIIMGGRDMADTTFTVGEVYAGKSDLYFRFDGIYNALDDMEAARIHVNGADVKAEEDLFCEDEDGKTVVCDSDAESGSGKNTGTNSSKNTGTGSSDNSGNNSSQNAATSQKSESGTTASGGSGTAASNEAGTSDQPVADKTTENQSTQEKNSSKTISSTAKNSSSSNKNNTVAKSPFDTATMKRMLALTKAIDGKWVQITDVNAEPAENGEAGEQNCAEDEETNCVEGTVVDDGTGETGTETGAGEDATTEKDAAGDAAEGAADSEALADFDLSEYTVYLNKLIESIGGRAAVCSADLMKVLRDNSSLVTEFYKKSPFISGKSGGAALASSRYPVYQIVIDQINYTDFVSQLQERGLLNDYLKCAGAAASDVVNYQFTLPPVYVEVDSASNFSRFYVAAETGTATLTLNLELSYPDVVNVQQPVKFMTLQDLAEKLTTGETTGAQTGKAAGTSSAGASSAKAPLDFLA